MKELIILYAPTILTSITSCTAFIKVVSAFRKQKEAIVNSSEIKDLKKKIKSLEETINFNTITAKKLAEDLKNHDKQNEEKQKDVANS